MSYLYAISLKEIPQLFSWVFRLQKNILLFRHLEHTSDLTITLENDFEKGIKTVHNRIHDKRRTAALHLNIYYL